MVRMCNPGFATQISLGGRECVKKRDWPRNLALFRLVRQIHTASPSFHHRAASLSSRPLCPISICPSSCRIPLFQASVPKNSSRRYFASSFLRARVNIRPMSCDFKDLSYFCAIRRLRNGWGSDTRESALQGLGLRRSGEAEKGISVSPPASFRHESRVDGPCREKQRWIAGLFRW